MEIKHWENFNLNELTSEIDKLYNSLYYSEAFLDVYRKEKKLNRVDFIEENEIKEIFLYTVDNKVINFLPAMVTIDCRFFNLFCGLIKEKYGSKHVINTDYFYNEIKLKKFWKIENIRKSDVIMKLPTSEIEYLNSLGKTTRKHVKYYGRRFEREYPDVKYHSVESNDISLDLYNKIIIMNKERLSQKKGIGNHIDTKNEKRIELLRRRGRINWIENNGEILAGSVIEIVNNHYFLTEIGSKLEFDKYNIGQINLFNTINDCIKYNLKSDDAIFHFLFELTDYKKRFGGEQVPLYSYKIFLRKNLSYYLTKIIFSVKFSANKLIKNDKNIRIFINFIRRWIIKYAK